ncbi:MAG: TonB-dependent receptor [Bacteroidales bacterium]|jgi:iron complex outermembrane receptor protein|nr:TonB-dependent receptor [Bacteroidales bacterium]
MKTGISGTGRPLLIFNQWTRKGYSVYASLQKIIKITTLNLAYSILLLPGPVLGQTDTTSIRNHSLKEIVVKAEKSPAVYSQRSRVVTVVDRAALVQMPGSTINDLLENFSGMDIRQRGVDGVQADISFRGGSFDKNLILLNGVNISDPQTGHHSLNLPIDIEAVERIEILEGSGANIFGPNAFSGAINFITTGSQQNTTRAHLTLGDFGLFKGSLTSTYRIKNTSQFISASGSRSNGYTTNTDHEKYNFFYQLNHQGDYREIHFQAGYTHKQFGANSFYTPEYPNQYEETKTTFIRLKAETGKTLRISPVLYFRRHQDRFELFREDPASWYTGHNYHLTDVYGIKADARLSTRFGVTSLGAELRSENILSNVLGIPMNDTLKAPGEENGFYTRSYQRALINYSIKHSVAFSIFTLNAGVLASGISEKFSAFGLYPGMDLSMAINASLSVYASINRSLRYPTFTDLFYQGPRNTGNPDLMPEEAWNYETGIKFQRSMIQSDIHVFYRDARHLIAWVKPLSSDPSDPWETQNLTGTSTRGAGVKQRFTFTKYRIDQYIKSLSLSYTYLHQDVHSPDFETKYSLDYLKHHLALHSAHPLYRRMILSWSVNYQDRAGSFLYYDQSVKAYTGEKEFDPVWLVDVKLNYHFQRFDLYTEISNVFNRSYYDLSNISMPGRWFKAGVRITLAY